MTATKDSVAIGKQGASRGRPPVPKSCPFCGNDELIRHDGGGYKYLRCKKCWSTGGYTYSELGWIDTIKNWNKRQGVTE